ncbi:MAG: EpsI family protein [Deltaproteobacteria bacterium]|nr:EpsI family protein [Deltaproteobacteria bacterium]
MAELGLYLWAVFQQKKSGPKKISFPIRGRILNNAYQLKIYNFWDALTQQRTDGALVRLITSVYEDETLDDAEKRLQSFVRDVALVLEEYIPGKDLS